MRSLLPAPPVSTSWAEPFHTVPRASCSSTCPPVAWRTAAASQRAGANTTSASARPSSSASAAQAQGAADGRERLARAKRCAPCPVSAAAG